MTASFGDVRHSQWRTSDSRRPNLPRNCVRGAHATPKSALPCSIASRSHSAGYSMDTGRPFPIDTALEFLRGRSRILPPDRNPPPSPQPFGKWCADRYLLVHARAYPEPHRPAQSRLADHHVAGTSAKPSPSGCGRNFRSDDSASCRRIIASPEQQCTRVGGQFRMEVAHVRPCSSHGSPSYSASTWTALPPGIGARINTLRCGRALLNSARIQPTRRPVAAYRYAPLHYP